MCEIIQCLETFVFVALVEYGGGILSVTQRLYLGTMSWNSFLEQALNPNSLNFWDIFLECSQNDGYFMCCAPRQVMNGIRDWD